jgi:parallel beta-helix repeat protein
VGGSADTGRMVLRRQTPFIAAALVLAALCVALASPAGAGAVTSCDRVASPSGSDSAPGTQSAPFKTPAKLIDSLSAGQTGCLRAGTYGWSGDLSIRAAGITVASYPGELATLEGRLRIERSATGAAVEGLRLNGRNANNHVSPLVYADRAVLRDNEITNEGAPAICVLITTFYDEPAPVGVVLEGNRIHDCGQVGTNQQHGIYVGDAYDTVIRDNWIYRNADRGIQLYPDAQRTRITGNVIDSNGEGIIFGGEEDDASSNNVIEGNVISSSTLRHNVEASWDGRVGTGNVVRDNCVWSTRSPYRGWPDGSGIGSQIGFVAHDNLVASPLYVNRKAADYDLRKRSPCARL